MQIRISRFTDMKALYLIMPMLLLLAVLLLQQCTYNSLEVYETSDSCDVSNVTYAEDIQPVLENHCFRCHGADVQEAGLNFKKIEDVLEIAKSGQFSGVVNHEEGYLPMPQDRDQLPACIRKKIDAWIEELP